ncbi:MAG: DUF2330 domain-containing protein [Gemmataceae bacterium]|nr:DUF2330 domain-containing protein [Gemmata sp.]MDW8197797.1 DUF2330 domain-containing protein [Gemmataceae bacterium]
MKLLGCLILVAVTVCVSLPDAVWGCAVVPPPNQRVAIAYEEAFIVWDEKTKTEHFIRSANFHSSSYSFGFLVPTPTPPDLDVVTDDLFYELETITAPPVEYREQTKEVMKPFFSGCSIPSQSALPEDRALGGAWGPEPAKEGTVEVLEQKRVGDFDVAVLYFRPGAGDGPERGQQQLAQWLAKNGFEAPPGIEPWLGKYVQDQWCITAFKIARLTPDNRPKLPVDSIHHTMRPIRMSFQTDKPFYPYREPPGEPLTAEKSQRLLRVYLAAPSRYTGRLGQGGQVWPGATVWAGSVQSPRWPEVFKLAKLVDPPRQDGKPAFTPPEAAGMWLTEFEDRSSPRPAVDEVYFEPSPDPAPVARPPLIITRTQIVSVTPWWHLAIYLGVPVLLVAGSWITWRWLRRT